MKMRMKKQYKGNVWVGIIILLVFSLSMGLALLSITVSTLATTKRQENIATAQALADAGIEYGIWKLNQTPTGTYTGTGIGLEFPKIPMDVGEMQLSITGTGGSRTIKAVSYVPSFANPTVKRAVQAKVGATPNSEGIAFGYAVQVGLGGLIMRNDTTIYGNVYSNGNIVGAGTNKSFIKKLAPPNETVGGNAAAVGTITDVLLEGDPPTGLTGQNPVEFPSYDENFWKDVANRNNDPINSGYTQTGGTFGPRRVNGDLTLTDVTITGPLYVTGSVTVNGTTSLSNLYGSQGTVVLAEGMVNANGTINGTSSSPKGHILFIGKNNISLGAWSTGGMFYAPGPSPVGTLTIQPHCNPISITAYTLDMQPNSTLTYETGLATADFGVGGGAGAAWGLKEWKPVEP